MTDENITDNEKVMAAAMDICSYAAKQMLAGKKGHEVKDELVTKVGLDEATASSVVETAKEVIANLRQKMALRSVQKMMVIGGGMLLAGVGGAILFEAEGAKLCCAFFGLFGFKILLQAIVNWNNL